MKIAIFLVALFGASVAYAQSEPTISELLADGYEIVAASSREDRSTSIVFLQRRSSAFMCLTGPYSSVCFNLNNH